jgi:hypothetical protein
LRHFHDISGEHERRDTVASAIPRVQQREQQAGGMS